MTTEAPYLELTSGRPPLLLPRSPIRRILLPTDFSEHSLEPLGLAAELARATGAELHFLWVDAFGTERPSKTEFPSAADVASAQWHGAPERLHAMADEGVDVTVVEKVERAIEIGPAIALYADESEIDLIVMATRGRTGVAKYLLGSVTEQVVRYAPCSVLVVGPHAREHEPSDPPRILSAVDFSETSLAAAQLAHHLAQSLGGEHAVVHAVTATPVPTFYGLETTLTPAVWEDVVERSRKELGQYVDEHLEGAEWSVTSGGTVSEILRAADSRRADLLVLGSHGLTGLPRLLLGSVAEKVVRMAHIPVLVVRPAVGDDEAE